VAFVKLVRNLKQHKLIVLRILNKIMLSNISDICLNNYHLTRVPMLLLGGREHGTHEA
jgi:hypothetical protein